MSGLKATYDNDIAWWLGQSVALPLRPLACTPIETKFGMRALRCPTHKKLQMKTKKKFENFEF